MAKRFRARAIVVLVVGGVLFVASLVRPILAAIGQARTLDQLLTPVIQSWVTPAHTLYAAVLGLLLILFEVHRLSRPSNTTVDVIQTVAAHDAPAEPALKSSANAVPTSPEEGTEIKILMMFAEGIGKKTTSDDVAKRMSISEHRAIYYLDRLRDMQVIAHSEDEWKNGRPVYRIRREGRDLLARLNLLQ